MDVDLEQNLEKLIDNLISKDKTFYNLHKQIGLISFTKRELNFESLTRIIINQQLSSSAAKTIFSRFKKLFPNQENLTPQLINEIKFETIREQGVSTSKTEYIKNLSVIFLEYPNLINSWKDLNDELALYEIQKIKGLGPWSANIILLFYMGRENIFPFGDTTLKKAFLNLYNKSLDKDLVELKWAEPFKSVVALYFWKWVDNGMIKLKHI